MAYVRALLMPGVSGNCWALAQAVGHDRPFRLQHLLSGFHSINPFADACGR
jgi:hypothetical protein